ncbi:MAG: hypothetical protein U0271_06580 [Polyangiaceae bacterium]
MRCTVCLCVLVLGCSSSRSREADSSPSAATSVESSAPSSGPTASAKSAAPRAEPPPKRGFRERAATGHIELVAEAAEPLPYGEESMARFVPDDEALKAAEAALPAALAAERRASRIVPKLATYHRQYYGFVAGSKRHIYINAFCEKEERMRTQSVMVDDGGDCFFQADYSIDDKAFLWVRVNGEA